MGLALVADLGSVALESIEEGEDDDETALLLFGLVLDSARNATSRFRRPGRLARTARGLFDRGLVSVPGVDLRATTFSFPIGTTGMQDLRLLLAGRISSRKEAIVAALKRAVSAMRAGAASSFSLESATEILKLVGAKSTTWIRAVVDLWAYRWYSIGAFDAADTLVAQGFARQVVAINNPPGGPDKNTTPFCRWVHTKVLARVRVRGDVEAFAAAVRVGDDVGAPRLWRLLDGDEARQDGDRALLGRLGLPPYHWRCRTVVTIR